MIVGSRHEPSERRVAARFAAAWERGDYATMHSLLTERARAEYPLRRFSRAYERAADTRDALGGATSAPRVRDDGRVDVGVTAATRIFGEISGRLALAVEEAADGTPGIAWTPGAGLPGPARRASGSSARRTMPPRAAIQARDGTIIAQGEARLSDLGPLASEVAGRVGPAPPEREEELARRGVPEGTPVGLTGLERTFDERLAGKPGGTLKAGGARARPQRAESPGPRSAPRSTRRSRRRR